MTDFLGYLLGGSLLAVGVLSLLGGWFGRRDWILILLAVAAMVTGAGTVWLVHRRPGNPEVPVIRFHEEKW